MISTDGDFINRTGLVHMNLTLFSTLVSILSLPLALLVMAWSMTATRGAIAHEDAAAAAISTITRVDVET